MVLSHPVGIGQVSGNFTEQMVTNLSLGNAKYQWFEISSHPPCPHEAEPVKQRQRGGGIFPHLVIVGTWEILVALFLASIHSAGPTFLKFKL
ncbi:MAG: hypothetical protein F6K19_04470 [Cyanothece sp. SIO1E1]|nr:hypothetical protein [Cyanothece sp. SIO1E1]